MLHKYKECVKCGKRFLEVRDSDLCPDCRVTEESEFTKVDQYMYYNPSANLAEISDATKVAEEEILKWEKEGKLKEELKPGIRCEVCGRGIKIGRICDKCGTGLSPDNEVAIDLRESEEKETVNKKAMHANILKRKK